MTFYCSDYSLIGSVSQKSKDNLKQSSSSNEDDN